MRCPSCGNPESKVVDSRPSEDGTAIRRRRECLECGRRFTTYERLGDNPLIVIKADGSSEAYDRQKLMRGLLNAAAKRPIGPEQIASLIDSIEAELRNASRNEIGSKDLGDMVLVRLAKRVQGLPQRRGVRCRIGGIALIERVSIPLQQIDPDLPVPAYAYVGDAGVDLRATCDDILKPFERKLVPCGIAVAIPSGYAGFVLPRSGLAIKHGVSLVNAPGLIDSNYRGEIQAILVNLDPQSEFAIKRGDRIAQLVVMRVPDAAFDVCAELPDTERGAGGFGSSGVSL